MIEPLLQGRSYLLKLATKGGSPRRWHRSKYRGQRQYPGASGGRRSWISTTSESSGSNSPPPSPSSPTVTAGSWAVSIPDRSAHQQRRRRGPAALQRCAALKRALAGPRCEQGGARPIEPSEALHTLVHRPVGRRANRPSPIWWRKRLHAERPADLLARRRQCAPRTQQRPGLHGRRIEWRISAAHLPRWRA